MIALLGILGYLWVSFLLPVWSGSSFGGLVWKDLFSEFWEDPCRGFPRVVFPRDPGLISYILWALAPIYALFKACSCRHLFFVLSELCSGLDMVAHHSGGRSRRIMSSRLAWDIQQEPSLKKTKGQGVDSVASSAYLPSMHNALGLISSTIVLFWLPPCHTYKIHSTQVAVHVCKHMQT
jgi:hypothetical protein